jgi:hypothetical protein
MMRQLKMWRPVYGEGDSARARVCVCVKYSEELVKDRMSVVNHAQRERLGEKSDRVLIA